MCARRKRLTPNISANGRETAALEPPGGTGAPMNGRTVLCEFACGRGLSAKPSPTSASWTKPRVSSVREGTQSSLPIRSTVSWRHRQGGDRSEQGRCSPWHDSRDHAPDHGTRRLPAHARWCAPRVFAMVIEIRRANKRNYGTPIRTWVSLMYARRDRLTVLERVDAQGANRSCRSTNGRRREVARHP